METTNSVIVPFKNSEGCHLSGNDSCTSFDGFWQKNEKHVREPPHTSLQVLWSRMLDNWDNVSMIQK